MNDDTRWMAASSLGKIDSGNEVAIATLVQILHTNVSNYISSQAAESLGQILQNSKYRFAVVKTSSDYQLLNDYYCYRVLWNCAQNMPYPDFYKAWHQHNIATRAMQSLKKIHFTRII
ncbi:hypothetical protein QUB80_21125 [Chlorogloeopsis sp. ULAP01]|uniref:HEAT repeat domain-containing protein n=1 Tax=Chlorogloeopsis sp. ULAP01 TaxID=3056483 RepID=UPI0025AAA6F6|nr:hypothetical protein [Chlorogloeopsis sp. ULAP01]MDM9383199.1 hypothetical protein [Chlorogloeopsis sp. ULAP01]